MTDVVDFLPARDPLYRDVALPFTRDLPVLGLPVRFATNSRYVLGVVDEAFGDWARYPLPVSADGVLRFRLVVHAADDGGEGHAAMHYRVPDPKQVLLVARNSVALADIGRGEAVAFVTPSLAADRAHFRYAVVEGCTLPLVTARDRQPLHAAAIVRDGLALLLAGPSGVGKSSVAYAAWRAGWQVLAEDEVFLEGQARFRVWGMPGRLHLPPEAASRHPELAATTVSLLANGKRKLAVPLPVPEGLPPFVERAVVCLLERPGDRCAASPLAPAEVEDGLLAMSEPGFDVFRDTIGPAVARLAAGGGWRLRLSADPAETLPALERIRRSVPP